MKLENLATRIGQPARPPLRTLKEMAEEFGVPCAELASLLRHRDGPDARMDTTRSASNGKAHWYEPGEMRKWWKGVSK